MHVAWLESMHQIQFVFIPHSSGLDGSLQVEPSAGQYGERTQAGDSNVLGFIEIFQGSGCDEENFGCLPIPSRLVHWALPKHWKTSGKS